MIVPGRCETIDEGQNFGVVVDAADNPEALSRLLDSVRECVGDSRSARIFLIFGCRGGDRPWQRPHMGEVAHYKVRTHGHAHVYVRVRAPCCVPSAGFAWWVLDFEQQF